jgi:hypothetical protein
MLSISTMIDVACAIGPSVNSLPFSFQNHFLHFNWISNDKLLKIQYLPHLKSKNIQITFIESYSRVHPNFPLLIFWFRWICSLNFVHYSMSSPLYVDTWWNQLSAPLLNKGFPTISKAQQEAPWVGKFEYDKQNKTNYINYIYKLKFRQICWTNLHTLLHALSHLLGNKIT